MSGIVRIQDVTKPSGDRPATSDPCAPGPRAAAWVGIRAWWIRVSSDAVRARRVSVLVASFAVLGIADLALTLSYMSGIGLFEGNPLARALALGGGPTTLAAFKVLTILLSAVILFALRTKRSAELAAWLCVLVMSVVSLEWRKYSSAADEIVLALQAAESAFADRADFVALP